MRTIVRNLSVDVEKLGKSAVATRSDNEGMKANCEGILRELILVLLPFEKLVGKTVDLRRFLKILFSHPRH